MLQLGLTLVARRLARRALGPLALLVAQTTHAHQGHGLDALLHWHASEVMLAIVLTLVAAWLVWRGRR